MNVESILEGPFGDHMKALKSLQLERAGKLVEQSALYKKLAAVTAVQRSENKKTRKLLAAAVAISRRPGLIG